MQVKDLMAQLSELDPNLYVFVDKFHDGYPEEAVVAQVEEWDREDAPWRVVTIY